VQIGAELLCKSAKVEPDYRVRSTDYGGEESVNAKVQIGAELLWKGGKGMTKKVGTWLCRVLVFIGGQGEALSLPASGARERQLGWHAVPTLPEAVEGGTGERLEKGAKVQISLRPV